MGLEAFNIEIIDTVENSRVEILEHTQINAPHLIFNGSEDKHQNIFASQLNFDFVVNDGTDAKFSHLFTSDEKRYLVKLIDTTDELTPVTVWQGHLLPEQFTEPYITGGFFVGFTATDGLARLKGYDLPEAFYTDQKSVLEIIAKCLEYTGNAFTIFIAPAIVNAVEGLRMDQLFLNGLSFIDGIKKTNAYDILENILNSFGLKIFQWKGDWYIIGLNRWDSDNITFEWYTAAGAYISSRVIARESHPIYFDYSGEITLIPPFKSVSTTWKNEYEQKILPENIFYQPSTIPVYFSNPVPVQHWTENGNIVTTLAPKDYQQNYFEINPNSAAVNGIVTPVLAVDPWYLAINGMPSGTPANTDYIELTAPIYLDTFVNGEAKLKLEIDFITFVWADISGAFTTPADGAAGDITSPYDNKYNYELLLDGVTLVSNSAPFPDSGYFNFKITNSEKRNIKGSLKLENIPIAKSGYLQLRIYQPLNRYNGSFPEFNPQRTVYTKINLEFETEQEEIIAKTRSIETSFTKKIDVYHADDAKDLTNRQILIDPAYSWAGITITETAGYKPQNTFNFSAYTNGADSYNQKEVDLTGYNNIINNLDKVYIYRGGTYTLITESEFTIFTDNGRFFFRMLFVDGTPIIESEDVFIYTAASSYLETDKRYLRERWKRYGQTEEIRFLEALNRVIHDTVKNPLQKLSGSILGIIGPLNKLTFSFNGNKNYIPVSIDIDLSNGNTNITAIDQTTEIVTDYD